MDDCMDSKIVSLLRTATSDKALSHAIILSGAGNHEKASKYVAAAHICQSEKTRPCLACNACHKVLNNIHPDVIFVQDFEHKELQVDTIRDVRQDVYIFPNEASAKVYIFPNCEQLNERDQNVLLKIVEEGPSYASFVFCTETISRLLPTIRSRCIEIKMPSSEEGAKELHPLTEPFFHALCSGRNAITSFCVEQENRRSKREDLDSFFSFAYTIPAEALLIKSGKSDASYSKAISELSNTFNRRQLNDLVNILKYYREEFQYNVGVGHVWGALCSMLHDYLDQNNF